MRATHQRSTDRPERLDPLTGLPNRAELVRRMAAVTPPGTSLLLVLDVDAFATVITAFGREPGDEVIRRLARRVRAARPAGDIVARIGEHQLAVLVADTGGPPPDRIARRLSAVVEEPVLCGSTQVSVTCSVGIASSRPDRPAGDGLVADAVQAATAAQRAGRGRCVTFDQALRAHAITQSTLERDLRDAVRFGWIETEYSPVLALGTDPSADGVHCVVARPRWTLGDGTSVPAARFVQLADDLGFAGGLGMQVLDSALDALASWRESGCGVRRLAVDLPAGQLEDPELAHQVSARLADRVLPARSLAVRVSAARLRESEQAVSTLGMLRSLGLGVELADFGRSGTSLTALRRLPLTAIALDAGLAGDLERADAVPRAVLAMCGGLGLGCTVEGVRSAGQLEAARSLGAGAALGSLVGLPLDAGSVPGLIARIAAQALTVV